MKINMETWISDIIRSDERFAMPIMTHPGIEMIGKNVYNAVTDASIHQQAVKCLAEKYPSIASTVIMDLTVEAEAFGMSVSFSEDEVPNVTGRIVSDSASINALKIPSLNAARIPIYIQATKLMSHSINKPLISGCIGPFSLAGRLYDMSEIMMSLYIDPASIKVLLEKCTLFIIAYCESLKDAGASGVLIAEPASGLLSNDLCLEFSSIYIKQIVDKVQSDSFSVFLHNCGNRGQCTSAMIYTGAAGYHFGNAIDIVQALKECPNTTLVMGNLDPVTLFKLSDDKTVYNETYRLLELTRDYSNFVISSGCDIPPQVPLSNIDAFYQAISDYNTNNKR